jgi:ribose/xylose/arabinose/galactoside ABC-type transport system permease subunit
MRQFFTIRNILDLILNSSILGLLVIAETLCLLVGKFDLSIESTLGFSALIGGFLAVNFHINPLIAWVIALSCGLLIGLFNGIMIVKVGLNPFLQTLAMLVVLRGFMVTISGGYPVYPLPNFFLIFGSSKVFKIIPTPVVIMGLMYVMFTILLQKRRFGRVLYVVGSNPNAAFSSGINVNRINIIVFSLSGLIAAFTGLVYAGRLESIPILIGKGMIFEVFAAAVLGGVSLSGGKGNLIGALGGVIFLGIVSSMLTWFGVGAFAVEAIRGCFILFAVILDAIKNQYKLSIT